MISKACKYGIRAMVFVASRHGENKKLSNGEIASEVDAPEAFTAKILQILTRNKIISSLKGPGGGFYLKADQLEQPVLNLVKALDGLEIFQECGLGLKQCSASHPCPMHDQYKLVREALLEVFATTSIAQLAEEVIKGGTFISNPI
jgi:Rrf2 family protein